MVFELQQVEICSKRPLIRALEMYGASSRPTRNEISVPALPEDGVSDFRFKLMHVLMGGREADPGTF